MPYEGIWSRGCKAPFILDLSMTNANEGVVGKPVQIAGAWQSAKGPKARIFLCVTMFNRSTFAAGTEKIVSSASVPTLGELWGPARF